jgi:hypothetical protein
LQVAPLQGFFTAFFKAIGGMPVWTEDRESSAYYTPNSIIWEILGLTISMENIVI